MQAEILIELDHRYKRKPKRTEVKKGKERQVQPPGCAVCGRAKFHRDHLGAPPSMNDGGSGMDRHAYQALKGAWEEALTGALAETDLPRPCAQILVEGLIGFDKYLERDQGNHRWMIEKALGDALVTGGWLVSDCIFPVARYEFGGLRGVHAPGESWTRLILFASDVEPPAAERFDRPARGHNSTVPEDAQETLL